MIVFILKQSVCCHLKSIFEITVFCNYVPQIDFVAHDDLPYNCGDTEDVYKYIKEMGKFVPIQRTPGVSTTDLIARIVRDYDIYVRRNLARGYSAKDLNVSYMKVLLPLTVWRPLLKPFFCFTQFQCLLYCSQEKEVHFRERFQALRTKFGGTLEVWEEKSKDLLGGFMGLFGRDGRIVSLISARPLPAPAPPRPAPPPPRPRPAPSLMHNGRSTY